MTDHSAPAARPGIRRVALTRRVLADLDTPLSVYTKLGLGRHSFLLESVEGGEKWGRYSIIGLPARRTLVVRGHEVTVSDDDDIVERTTVSDPLAFVAAYLARYETPPLPELPRFCGGLVGYFGYDTVRYVEPRVAASSPPDALGTPDIYLLQVDDFVVFDNLRGELMLVKYVDADDDTARAAGETELARLAARLREPLPALPADQVTRHSSERDFASEFGHEAFLAAVER
ncbi:MAG: anthranilate synthase component I, partial [Gammaproteobacteria bacterium]